MTTRTPAASPRQRTPALDAQCAAAIDLARAAAEQVAGAAAVGEHVRAYAEGDRVVTHAFASALPGYAGWEWAVTVARASRSRDVTVDEAVLLPGAGALVAPAWVPYRDRIQPGDLGPGEILPTDPGDARLEPGYTEGALDAPADLDPPGVIAYELGLGRVRVLSPWGRDAAADRWYDGAHGPRSAIAQAAPAQCSTCGYLIPMGGPLRDRFGVCANEWSPSDGAVVSYDHGCGAHSEAAAEAPEAEPEELVIDTASFDELALSDPTGDPTGA